MTVPRQRGEPAPMENTASGVKLDQISNDVTEVRVSMATLSGDVRAALGRLDGHDRVADDMERRIRTLERRSYAIPGIATIIAVAGLIVALWPALRH